MFGPGLEMAADRGRMAAKETLHFFLFSENLFTCLHQPIKKITIKLRIGLDSVP